MCSGVSDISDPNRIRGINIKVLLQLVSRHDSRLGAILTRTTFIADLRPQAFITLELSNSVRRSALAQAQQVMMDLTITVNTTAL